MSIISRPEWVSQILEIVTSALENERIEVREKAAGVLSGLLHCGFMSAEKRTELLVRTDYGKGRGRAKIPISLPSVSLLKGTRKYPSF